LYHHSLIAAKIHIHHHNPSGKDINITPTFHPFCLFLRMDLLNRLLDEWGSATAMPPGLPSIVLWIFAAFVLIQLILFWSTYARIIFYSITTPRLIDPKPPVSVVIAARDEYLNLCENLPAVLEQDYPDFEVIVVNNESTDDSAILLRNYQQQYPHLKVITLEKNLNFFKGKKFPSPWVYGQQKTISSSSPTPTANPLRRNG
jgi:hypothetical protein